MFRRSHPLSTFTWLAGAVIGVACSIPDYDARQKPDGEGGEDPGSGGVSGQSTNGGVTSAGNGPIGGSAGSSTPGGTAGDSGGSSGGSGKSAAGDGGESGSNGGNAGNATAGNTGSGGAGNTGGAGSGGGAGKGGAGSGGTAGNTGGAGSGGAGKGGAGNGGAGSGGAGKGGAGNGGAGSGGAGKGGAGNGGAGSGGAGKGGGGSGGSGPLCFTQNSSNLLVNAGFNNSNVSQYVAQDAFIALSHSTLDATGCASSGSLVVTNSHPDGLNSGALYCLTAISPGTTYNVGGWMMEPSGFAQGQVFLHFIFTDGPSCTGSFVGDVTSLEGPSLSSPFDTWRSVRADGLVAPPGAVSLGVHTRVIKNFPNTLAYRAHFDMLYATPVPGAF